MKSENDITVRNNNSHKENIADNRTSLVPRLKKKIETSGGAGNDTLTPK